MKTKKTTHTKPMPTHDITAKNGLLWRNGVVIPLPEADIVAAAYGFPCAERLVAHLSRPR